MLVRVSEVEFAEFEVLVEVSVLTVPVSVRTVVVSPIDVVPGLIVAPDPVSQTLPLLSVATPPLIVV